MSTSPGFGGALPQALAGHLGGQLSFAEMTGARAMLEKYPLASAAEAYARIHVRGGGPGGG